MTALPRVLFVTNMYPTAAQPAAGVFVHRQAAALRELGASVDVEVVSMDRGARDYLLARPRIGRAIRSLQPDVVHIHFGYTFLAVPAIAPRVITYYGDDLNGASTGRGGISLKSRVGREVSRLAARRSEATIVVSEPMLRWLPPSTRSRAEVVRDSIDPREFRPGDRRLARQRLGIAADEVVVLFPHSLAQPTKRIDLARAAVDGFTTTQPRARLLVVNGAPPQAMPDYYRAAD
ncbi:MAG TPA: glycosyltransferase, partial [Gemmatimonadaceae bacterium]|nr:glycosyltransferase [Gemmatimonadaceae bacterium]